MEQNFDFWNDLDFVIKDLLHNLNIKYGKNKQTNELILDYLTVQEKMVSRRPRKVFISNFLETKLASHPKRKEIYLIWRRLENGEDVNYFQSETLFQSRLHDHLVAEWKIHHFHLSTELKPNSKFRKRTKALLFVKITEDKAYLLDVKNHTRKDRAIFADPHWVGVLHKDFPEVILDNKNKIDMPVDSTNYSAEERIKLWDNGFTTVGYNIDGVVYHSPGIGRMTSGHSIHSVIQQGHIIRWVHYVNEIFKTRFEQIKEKLGLMNPILQLVVSEYGFSIVDHELKLILLIYPNKFEL